MPAISRKATKIQYRKLDADSCQDSAFDLQLALNACVNNPNTSTASLRKIEFDEYGTLILNFCTIHRDYFVGEIVRFEPGADISLLESSEDAQGIFNLRQQPPPGGHDLLKGTFYFMVINNHVMIIENEIPAQRIEKYLTRLLREKCALLEDNAHIILDAELSTGEEGSKLKDIDQIIFKPEPVRAINPAATSGTYTATTSTDIDRARAIDVMIAAGIDETDIGIMVQDDAQFEVALHIKMKKGRRRCVMPAISANRLLRNISEDELVLSGPAGREKNGRIVKLSYNANIQRNGAIYVYTDVGRALLEAYNHFIQNGHIE